MALSKLEIQQMLREMNIKFPADETFEELSRRLQQAHHELWLKSVSAKSPAGTGGEQAVVKKRRKAVTPLENPTHSPEAAGDSRPAAKATPRPTPVRRQGSDSSYRPRPILKPEPGQPWKAAAEGTEPFNRKKKVFESVLKRAGLRCERCDGPSGAADLQPFHIQPLDQGGEHSIKNVVALCPACLEAMQNDTNSKDLKELKRKTRARLYDSLEVMTRKKTPGRRGPSRRKP